jgi:hypothetical protein
LIYGIGSGSVVGATQRRLRELDREEEEYWENGEGK